MECASDHAYHSYPIKDKRHHSCLCPITPIPCSRTPNSHGLPDIQDDRRSRINDLRIGPNYAPRGTTTRGQRRVRVIGSYLLTWGINGLTEGSAESKRSRLMGQARQSDRMTEHQDPNRPGRIRAHGRTRAPALATIPKRDRYLVRPIGEA